MIKKYISLLILATLPFFSSATDGEGTILRVEFLGENFTSSPDIVQFRISGGFKKNGCDHDLAGIRAADSHLVSALLAAKMADREISVALNLDDKFFANRCAVTAVVIH